MAVKPRWTYAHAWFAWQLLKLAPAEGAYFGRDHEPFFGADVEGFFSPAGTGLDRAEEFPEPRTDGSCPREHAALGRRLREHLEPEESLSVRVATEAVAAADHALLDVDLRANDALAAQAFLSVLRAERVRLGIEVRSRPRGGDAPWGVFGPVLAMKLFRFVLAGGEMKEWLAENWRRLPKGVRGKARRDLGDKERTQQEWQELATNLVARLRAAIAANPLTVVYAYE